MQFSQKHMYEVLLLISHNLWYQRLQRDQPVQHLQNRSCQADASIFQSAKLNEQPQRKEKVLRLQSSVFLTHFCLR